MTRQRMDGKGTPFGEWLRTRHQGKIGSHTFSAQNLDYIWHNYRENWFITIEEKRYGGMRDRSAQRAQRDTHGIVAQLLEGSSGMDVDTLRGHRRAEYRGHYEIVFDRTSPDDGDMTINGRQANEQDLLRLLTVGRWSWSSAELEL